MLNRGLRESLSSPNRVNKTECRLSSTNRFFLRFLLLSKRRVLCFVSACFDGLMSVLLGLAYWEQKPRDSWVGHSTVDERQGHPVNNGFDSMCCMIYQYNTFLPSVLRCRDRPLAFESCVFYFQYASPTERKLKTRATTVI